MGCLGDRRCGCSAKIEAQFVGGGLGVEKCREDVLFAALRSKIQPGLTCKGGELAENATKGFSALSRVVTMAGAGIAAAR